MKPFIVFLALILVFTCLCTCSNDMSQYKKINIALKSLAEEIACGGGLMTGSSLAAENVCISLDDAKSYAEFIISKAEKSPLFSQGKLTWDLSLENDQKTITAVVNYEAVNMPVFHLFDSETGFVSRKSSYEWVDINVK